MYPMGASLCLKCGYRWNSQHVKPPRCPNCKTEEWDKEPEGEACGLDGGICDQCGCRFTTELGKAKYCPNCRSDKWDSGKQDQSKIKKARSKQDQKLNRLDELKCNVCGHEWIFGKYCNVNKMTTMHPRQCPKCHSRRWDE